MSRKIVLLSVLTSCTTSNLEVRSYGGEDPSQGASAAFDEAASSTDVPSELLLAIGYVETRMQMVVGEEEFPGQEPAYGVMALRGEALERGAELAGLTVEEVRYERDANVLAAAALMSAWAAEEGIEPSDLAAWAPVVARYSGIVDNDEAVSEYVHLEVYETLNEGVSIEGDGGDGGVVAAPSSSGRAPIVPDWPAPPRHGMRTGDSGAIWTGSPNHSSRSGASADFVIIHTCEGSYSGCWSWLANSASGVSAHYVVNDSGSEVRQLVDEDRKAWHISANYDCGNNGGFECSRNGDPMNSWSIGIEHAGYSSQSSWSSGLIQRSAELTCGITQRHNIPRDSYHIVGHGQLQPWNRTDPGANWPWSDYMSRIGSECGDGGPSNPPSGGGSGGSGSGSSSGTPFTIDSNNNANDVSHHYVEVSGNWWGSANVSGYYNTGYWVAPTDSVSDGASFWFDLDTDGCWSVEAWWPAASDRSPAITWIGWDADDREVGRTVVDQRTNGARWNHLGDWDFGAGWNRVMLSRWTSPGAYAVADAVRLTPCD